MKAAFDLLAPYIKSCHINDLTNDAAGKYPYRELFRLLKGIKYDPGDAVRGREVVPGGRGTEFSRGTRSCGTS